MVTIKLFGIVKNLIGQEKELVLDLPGGSKVRDLVEMLQSRFPDVGELVLKKKVLVSVNQEIAHEDTEITTSDEIALLPPFAGGAM